MQRRTGPRLADNFETGALRSCPSRSVETCADPAAFGGPTSATKREISATIRSPFDAPRRRSGALSSSTWWTISLTHSLVRSGPRQWQVFLSSLNQLDSLLSNSPAPLRHFDQLDSLHSQSLAGKCDYAAETAPLKAAEIQLERAPPRAHSTTDGPDERLALHEQPNEMRKR